MKYRIVVFILITTMGSVYAMAQVVFSGKRGGEKIRPVKIYKRHQLADISADGRYVLFDLVGRSKYGMKIIEAESGREVARKNEKAILMQFIPNTNSIFYVEIDPDTYKVWDFRTGVTKGVCIKEIWEAEIKVIKGFGPVLSAGFAAFLSEKESIGLISYFYNKEKKKKSELLVKLELSGCNLLKVLGDIYEPGLEKLKEGEHQQAEGITFVADEKQMSYMVGNKIIVRNTSTFEIEKIFTVETPLKLFHLRLTTFTANGRRLILQAENFTDYNPHKRRYLLLTYDAKTFKKLRQFEVISKGIDNLAVSPNGRFAAVAYKTVEEGFLYLFSHFNQIVEQAHIDLFDMETGKKVATMSHKKMGERPNAPWIWEIYKMKFTPDGKYLLTSSHRDTYVWDVATLTSNESLTSSTRK